MVERRQQGRPLKGTKQVGRTRIVESLRSMMRNRASTDFSRKNLAKYSGVTPALITYYFPSRDALIEEATSPIIEEYFRDLHTILNRDVYRAERLQDVIKLLIRLYGRDGRILQAYEDLARLEDYRMDPDYLQLMSSELSEFLGNLIDGGETKPYDLDVLQCAIRGMCEIVARHNLGIGRDGGDEKADALEANLAIRLFDLITYGLNCWGPSATPELSGATTLPKSPRVNPAETDAGPAARVDGR